MNIRVIGFIFLALTTSSATAQLASVRCCTREPLLKFAGTCMDNPDQYPTCSPWYSDFCYIVRRDRCLLFSACVYGFANTIKSYDMMASMCNDLPFPLDTSTWTCESWRATQFPIALVCSGLQTSNFRAILDIDGDDDFDLRDYARLQNDFGR